MKKLAFFACIAAATISVTTAIAADPTKLPDTSDATRGLDLSAVTLTPLYEADFKEPLNFIKEADLFADGKRVRKPEGAEWVLEGQASAQVKGGRLHLTNDAGHLVFWSTRPFPADVLLEFGVSPVDANKGLAIVFLAATGRDGGSIFDLGQPFRDGVFNRYHSGELNCYHVSYWATDPNGEARGTAHIRKNHGFHLVSQGRDFITGTGPGPHLVRVLKLGSQISVEVDGKLSVRLTDDGQAFGPALRGGLLGLRQMVYSRGCSYTHFKVWGAKTK
jgi:hypothetical protein